MLKWILKWISTKIFQTLKRVFTQSVCTGYQRPAKTSTKTTMLPRLEGQFRLAPNRGASLSRHTQLRKPLPPTAPAGDRRTVTQ